MNIWLIILFLFSGFTIGFLKPLSKKFFKIAENITKFGLIILLASMGAKIGVDDRVINQLGSIGYQAFFIALSSLLGSVLLVKLFSYRLFEQGKKKINMKKIDEKEINEEKIREEEIKEAKDNSMTYVIIGSVVGGFLLGYFILPDSFFSYLDIISTYALAVLLFGVGLDIGLNREVLKQVKTLGWQILFLPFLVAVGSIGGAFLVALCFGMAANEATAVGAGFGWYSLSGVLLAKIHSVELGSLAFLANVFRELLTIIFLPLVVKYLGKITAIAPGGATTMDVTLPLIKEAAGEEMVIPAFVNGAILSALVPILVPFLINL